MQIDATVLFENESFDSPVMPDGNHVSHGNTTIEDLTGTANAFGTIALNRYEGGKTAKFLEKKFDIPAIIGPTPIGNVNGEVAGFYVKGKLCRYEQVSGAWQIPDIPSRNARCHRLCNGRF